MRALRDKRELTERNQRMVAMRDAGKKFKDIAAEFKLSPARVFGICAREQGRLIKS